MYSKPYGNDPNDLDHVFLSSDQHQQKNLFSKQPKFAKFLAGLFALFATLAISAPKAEAQELRIVEVFVGTSTLGTPSDQYIVLQMLGANQGSISGESITVYDEADSLLGTDTFASDFTLPPLLTNLTFWLRCLEQKLCSILRLT